MFKIRHNFQQNAVMVDAAKRLLPSYRRTALVACAVQIQSWAIQDFRERARGGTAGGIRWAPLTRSAIATRLAARAPWKSITTQLAALSTQQALLVALLTRKLPAGKEPFRAKQRAGIAARWMETPEGQRLKAIREQRKGLRGRRQGLIDAELPTAEIGVDTGRLINSLVAAVPELKVIQLPAVKDGPPPPKALFVVGVASITVGTNLMYAEAFDKLRPIYPASFIDTTRLQKLNEIAERVYQKQLAKDLKGREK